MFISALRDQLEAEAAKLLRALIPEDEARVQLEALLDDMILLEGLPLFGPLLDDLADRLVALGLDLLDDVTEGWADHLEAEERRIAGTGQPVAAVRAARAAELAALADRRRGAVRRLRRRGIRAPFHPRRRLARR